MHFRRSPSLALLYRRHEGIRIRISGGELPAPRITRRMTTVMVGRSKPAKRGVQLQ